MKPSKQAIERAARAIRGWLSTECKVSQIIFGRKRHIPRIEYCRVLAAAALTAAMEPGRKCGIWAGKDFPHGKEVQFGLIRLEDE